VVAPQPAEQHGPVLIRAVLRGVVIGIGGDGWAADHHDQK
jgi:hypothetical protein